MLFILVKACLVCPFFIVQVIMGLIDLGIGIVV